MDSTLKAKRIFWQLSWVPCTWSMSRPITQPIKPWYSLSKWLESHSVNMFLNSLPSAFPPADTIGVVVVSLGCAVQRSTSGSACVMERTNQVTYTFLLFRDMTFFPLFLNYFLSTVVSRIARVFGPDGTKGLVICLFFSKWLAKRGGGGERNQQQMRERHDM